MHTKLTDSQQRLANFMSDLSETAYYAGWMLDLEYVLWDAVLNGERKYGHHIITRAEINTLVKLSTEANCCIYFDNENEETAIPLAAWATKFTADVALNPKRIRG